MSSWLGSTFGSLTASPAPATQEVDGTEDKAHEGAKTEAEDEGQKKAPEGSTEEASGSSLSSWVPAFPTSGVSSWFSSSEGDNATANPTGEASSTTSVPASVSEVADHWTTRASGFLPSSASSHFSSVSDAAEQLRAKAAALLPARTSASEHLSSVSDAAENFKEQITTRATELLPSQASASRHLASVSDAAGQLTAKAADLLPSQTVAGEHFSSVSDAAGVFKDRITTRATELSQASASEHLASVSEAAGQLTAKAAELLPSQSGASDHMSSVSDVAESFKARAAELLPSHTADEHLASMSNAAEHLKARATELMPSNVTASGHLASVSDAAAQLRAKAVGLLPTQTGDNFSSVRTAAEQLRSHAEDHLPSVSAAAQNLRERASVLLHSTAEAPDESQAEQKPIFLGPAENEPEAPQVALQADEQKEDETEADAEVTDQKDVDAEDADPKGTQTEAADQKNLDAEDADSKQIALDEPSQETSPSVRRLLSGKDRSNSGLMGRCWRCGRDISADMESVEAHEAVCARPSLVAEPPADPVAETSADAAGEEETSVADAGAEESQLVSTGSSLYAWTASGVSTLAGLGQSVKESAGYVVTKAGGYFYKDSLQLPGDGLTCLEHVQSGLRLSVTEAGEVRLGPAPSLNSESAPDSWLLVKASGSESFLVKAAHTGSLLRSADGEVLVGGGDEGETSAQWRFVALPEAGVVGMQNGESGLFLCPVEEANELEGASLVAKGGEPVLTSHGWKLLSSGDAGREDTSTKTPLTPDLDPMQVYSQIETTVEQVVLMTLEPVLKGIPSLGIPPVRVEARRSIGEHGSAEAAVAALLAKAEEEDAEPGMSQKVMRKASELLLMRFLPVLGAGAYLSYTMYSRLRLAALVAEMYGHDAEDQEIQGQLLFCIMPGSEASEEPGEDLPAGGDADADCAKGRSTIALTRAARGLGHGLAKQVLQRSTGWRTAADLYDLAAAIYSERASLEGAPVEVQDGPQVGTVKRSQTVFRPNRLRASTQPGMVVLLAVGAATPLALTAATQVRNWVLQLQLSSHFITALLLGLLLVIAAAVHQRWWILEVVSEQATERPQLVTSVVLITHASLPLFAAFGGTRMLVDGLQRPSLAAPDGHGAGLLLLLLGGWTWLRLWQRAKAPPGSAAARGEATPAQRALLATMLALGSADLLSADGLGLHGLPPFGALRSAHWLLGLISAAALECQLKLLQMLKNREVVLRLLGATRMMGLAVVLFLGGLTASVGFLVSRAEFTRFVDGLAPPPRAAALIVALRREQGSYAMALGAAMGLLWQLPPGAGLVTKPGGVLLGGAAAGYLWTIFEEHREALQDPSGGRWLLVLPETSETAKLQALKVWTKLRLGAAEAAVERSARFLGSSVLETGLNWAGSLFAKGAAEVAEEAIDVAVAVESKAT